MNEHGKSKPGRPGGESVPDDLLQIINTYHFPSGYLFKNKDSNELREGELSEAVSVISSKIRSYLLKHPKSSVVASLIKPKLGEAFDSFLSGSVKLDLLDTKTLKRCLTGHKASESTINVFKSFEIALLREKELNKELLRVTGLYYLFSTHSTQPGRFQISLLKIGEEESFLKFVNSENEVETKTLVADIIRSNNVLLTLKEDKFALLFYVYIGPINKPTFLQSVNIYCNNFGNTIANLAVFAKVKPMEEAAEEIFIHEFVPKRGASKLPENLVFANDALLVEQDTKLPVYKNIQHFLQHRSKPISTQVYQSIIPFDFSKSVAIHPGPYGQEARFYNKTRQYVGEYDMFFTERFKSVEEAELGLYKQSKAFSSVGDGVLNIRIDEKTGVLKCSLATRKGSNGETLVHEGFIINTRLGMSPYLLMSLYTGADSERCIILLVKIIDDNKMIGCHLIAYEPLGKLGAGVVMMVKRPEERGEGEEAKPKAFLPSDPNLKTPLTRRIVNYLSMRDQNLVIPPEYEDLEKKGADHPYEGFYKLYSVRDIGKGISVSLMQIFCNGFVSHEDSFKDIATGKLEDVGSMLNITLKNTITGRTGFCCISVNRQELPQKAPCYYGGSFAGVSRKSPSIPVASQFIMEFLGKEKPDDSEWQAACLSDNPEESNTVPKQIRDFLSIKTTKLSFSRQISQLEDLK